MQVKLEKTHSIAAPSAAAWQIMQDIHALAECMPGASITEQSDDGRYKGNVSVKVGPVQSVFKGTIRVTEQNDTERRISLSAKGKDRTGTSNATMELTASVADTADGCELVGNSEIKVLGKMANFGARMINGVADQLIAQFLENFSNRVLAAGEGSDAEAAAEKVAEEPRDLNVLALLWTTIAGFFRRLLGSR